MNWITPRKNSGIRINPADVIIRLYQNTRNTKDIAIRFMARSWERITQTGSFLIAVDQNARRLYFRGVPGEQIAFRLSAYPNDPDSYMTKFGVADPDEWTPILGDYNLRYDDEAGFYYIDYGEASAETDVSE